MWGNDLVLTALVGMIGGAIGAAATFLASRGKDQTQLVLDERQAGRESEQAADERYEREIARLMTELARREEVHAREMARATAQNDVMTVDRDAWLARFLKAIEAAEVSTEVAETLRTKVNP